MLKLFRNIIRRLGVGRFLYLHTTPVIVRRRKYIKGTPAEKLPPENWETLDLLVCCRNMLPSVKVIWDVGANRGTWATVARSIFPEAQIHSFEPHPHAFSELEQTARQLGNVISYNIALADRHQTKTFYITEPSLCSAFDRPIEDPACRVIEEKPIEVSAALELIESGRCPLPDLLKMDVQGHEYEVLLGMGEKLKQVKAVITELITWNGAYRGGSKANKILMHLLSAGFEIASVTYGTPADEYIKSYDMLLVNFKAGDFKV